MDEIEQVQEATTPSEMRAAIARLKRNNHLVHSVMDSADYTGLSSEDRYTMLAYHALSALAKTQLTLHRYLLTTPGAAFLVMPNLNSATPPVA